MEDQLQQLLKQIEDRDDQMQKLAPPVKLVKSVPTGKTLYRVDRTINTLCHTCFDQPEKACSFVPGTGNTVMEITIVFNDAGDRAKIRITPESTLDDIYAVLKMESKPAIGHVSTHRLIRNDMDLFQFAAQYGGVFYVREWPTIRERIAALFGNPTF